jgi:hypothetical protein
MTIAFRTLVRIASLACLLSAQLGSATVPAAAAAATTLRTLNALPPSALTAQVDAAADQYLDDRSTAAQVLASYFNAINRNEYARAYSYWEPAAATELPPFPEFAQGYSDTARVEVTIGDVRSDVGAGQLYFVAPVALQATTSAGATTWFIGCYTIHLARPQFQAVPPFRPMSIRAANVWEWNDAADRAPGSADLAAACTR